MNYKEYLDHLDGVQMIENLEFFLTIFTRKYSIICLILTNISRQIIYNYLDKFS